VKFTDNQASPEIHIGADSSGSELIFFVKDNGIGIAPQYFDRIFNLFEKLDSKSEGTGLGLALVKRIVELYGGRIWLESAPGKGACIHFTLPLALDKSLTMKTR
jgi:signal transduction histidine kinase